MLNLNRDSRKTHGFFLKLHPFVGGVELNVVEIQTNSFDRLSDRRLTEWARTMAELAGMKMERIGEKGG